MLPAHHILVPVDLGDITQSQLAYAMALGAQLRARLTLLHVIHIPHFVQPDLAAYMDAITNRTRQAMDDHLQPLIAAGIDAQAVLVHGIPWQEIVQTAKLKSVDLIILGKHARTGVQHALLGSVAEKIVRLAPCPVLVVPASASPTS